MVDTIPLTAPSRGIERKAPIPENDDKPSNNVCFDVAGPLEFWLEFRCGLGAS
jgi:hypothetical protein